MEGTAEEWVVGAVDPEVRSHEGDVAPPGGTQE